MCCLKVYECERETSTHYASLYIALVGASRRVDRAGLYLASIGLEMANLSNMSAPMAILWLSQVGHDS